MGKRSRMVDTSIPEHEEPHRDSRSRLRTERKRDQAERDALTQALVALPATSRTKLDLGEELERALTALEELKKGSAQARQRRLVARLLRLHDFEALTKKIALLQGKKAPSFRDQHVRRWEARLLEEGPPALDELAALQPTLDRPRLEKALAAALDELERGTKRRRVRQLRATLSELLPRDF